jgi:protein-tyrosine phosphatase
MNILFVCSGNVSRSFLAEMLLKNEVELNNLNNVSVSSAGLLAYPGNPSDPRMVEYLSKTGIPVKQHKSRQITEEDMDWADLILVMEKDHVKMIERSWPEITGKVELLGKFISEGPGADDIIDPYGGSPYHYRLAQSQIILAIRSLVKKFLSDKV